MHRSRAEYGGGGGWRDSIAGPRHAADGPVPLTDRHLLFPFPADAPPFPVSGRPGHRHDSP
ncbi:MAG: hypothetical protein ACK55I_17505, partial [bacterium]